MTNFQILGVGFSGLFALLAVGAAARGRLSWPAGLAWTTLWVTAAIAIANPGLTVVIAGWLGIARGADLIFYCGILAMFVGFFVVLGRLRRIEENITTIVREIAVERGGDSARSPSPPASLPPE